MPKSQETRPDDSPVFHVNGQPQPWSPGLTLAELLQRRGDAPQTVATALNGQFVPRQARAQTTLRAGDALTIFEAIVGG
ncbi:sulfur carrier protein ThiS [Aquabacterium sp.]|uniref:sulfur carrier protein ThiS n=1 Tax=Aquabacterium sp. TaxID=1872578 RepID=UPI002C91CD33|nr:sulfur carrier protein ThiS [Aquabacterium sp.]HSW03698.1 sulfur carrier protein ThiS [Aquabacterium sp.]